MNKLIVALTGGICSGKSRACEKLSALGCDIIDADEISRAVTADGTEVSMRIEESFGTTDRRRLREIVFGDEKKLVLLNSLTHPPIMARMKKEAEESESEIVVLAVPLLFEAGFGRLADISVTVSCDEETRIQRLIKRDNISRELAKKIIGSQMSDAERERLADIVIRNDGSEEEFSAEVMRVFGILQSRVKENKDGE